MKTKQLLSFFLTLLVVLGGLISGYLWGRASPKPATIYPSINLPPLIKLDSPPQTVNGITADVESYYADGLRLIFAVRITGSNDLYSPDVVTILDSSNQFINAGYGFQADTNDPSLYLIDANIENPLEGDKFEGVLELSVYPFTSFTETTISDSAQFKFDVNVPMKPVQEFTLNQTVTVNNIDMLLEKVIISPAFTQVYLCYNKPSQYDWMTGGTEFIVDSQTAKLGTYTLLYDSEYGDIGKSIEPNWSPPIETGRCVKGGFFIGSENPKSIHLKISSLEQSMPEVIPQDELAIAREKLLAQGIDMDWQVFSGNGGGGAGPVYNSLPTGMSEEEAYAKFIEALGYVHYGPWEFTINP